MKWRPRQDGFLAKACRLPFDGRVDRPCVSGGANPSKKELRAVAIEYSRSLPHRLESVEGVTIGRTRSARRTKQPDTTSRDRLLWTA
jgi:hypothetical protein